MLTSSQKLTTALVTPVPPPNGGMAIQGQKLAARLTESGFAVLVVATNPRFPAVLRFAEQIKGVRTLLRFWVYLWRLRALYRADVVHILAASHFFFFASVAPALVVAKVLRKRTILNYRGGEAEVFFARYRTFVRPFFRLADEIVVPSEFLVAVFREQLSLDVGILPNIADFDQFRYRPRTEIQPRMVVARSLEPIYGHAMLLKGLVRLKEKYPDALLHIAGEGSLRQTLEGQVSELGLESSVVFHGRLSPEELAELYDQSDIMINGSSVDNFPGALLEAFVCGLPVVTTAAGGIPWMVQDEVTGYLVPIDGDESLAQKIAFIIETPAAVQPVIAAARNFAGKYTWPQVLNQLSQLYQPAKDV